MVQPIPIAYRAKHSIELLPSMANRHGCITGATGTGKTVSLQVLAEAFSRQGTAVFAADIKGDLSGITQAGQPNEKITQRLQRYEIPEPEWGANPEIGRASCRESGETAGGGRATTNKAVAEGNLDRRDSAQ